MTLPFHWKDRPSQVNSKQLRASGIFHENLLAQRKERANLDNTRVSIQSHDEIVFVYTTQARVHFPRVRI